MNALGYRIEDRFGDEVNPSLSLNIDGEESMLSLEPAALEHSLNLDELLPILNCSCGIIDCGGGYVMVTHKGNKVIWETIYDGHGFDENDSVHKTVDLKCHSGSILKPPFIFDLKQYIKTVEEILAYVKQDESEMKNYLLNKERYKKGYFIG